MLFRQELINGLTLGGIYALVAMSFSIIFSVTKTFHFAHGAVYMWVAYVVATLQGPWGFVPALLAGLVTSLGLTLLIELIVYRPMRRNGAGGLAIFVASLGVLIVLENLVPVVFGSQVRPLNLPGLPASVHIGEYVIPSAGLVSLVLAVVVVVALVAMFRYTHLGRSFRAVASNPQMSTLVGLEAKRRYLLAFGLGALVLWPAAVFNSATTGVNPGLAENIILITLIAVIVGGVESVPGAALGGWLIGLSQSLSSLFFSSQWQTAVAFGVCIVFILFRPTGILGRTVLRSGV
ncbi:branched-chain amino acid ABC transporter permease [Actinoplanes sp. NPDC051411]|uniref:branched-chain amino acid ABC transporter permease n=1 Tax=Actinoplanes sp. NPDC051411 TaxID=3155522 RepID=UPI00341E5DBE